MDDKIVYTTSELIKLLGLSKNSIYQGLQNSTIPSRKVGRRFIIPKAAVDKWLMSGSATDSHQAK